MYQKKLTGSQLYKNEILNLIRLGGGKNMKLILPAIRITLNLKSQTLENSN